MKNLILIFAVALFSTQLLSQDLTYFFLNLPDEVFFGVSKEERKKIVKRGSSIEINGLTNKFTIDDDHGTFFCSGAMSAVSISYWDISNGNKLIVIWVQGGPPTYDSNLNFYYFDGKDFKLSDWLDVMSEEISIRSFFKNNPEQNIERMRNDLNWLPGVHFYKDGVKNMVMSWSLLDDKSNYEKYGIIGDEMELIWNDGKFIKGKVYWSKKE